MDKEISKVCYSDVQAIRRKLLEEVAFEFNGVPLTVDHYCLVEYRLQSVLASGCNITQMISGKDPIRPFKREES